MGCQAPLIWQPPPRSPAAGSDSRTARGDFEGSDAPPPNDGAQPNAGFHVPLPPNDGTPFTTLAADSTATLSHPHAELEDHFSPITTALIEDCAASAAGSACFAPAILLEHAFYHHELFEDFVGGFANGFCFFRYLPAVFFELAFSRDTADRHAPLLGSVNRRPRSPLSHACQRLPAAHTARPPGARGFPRA